VVLTLESEAHILHALPEALCFSIIYPMRSEPSIKRSNTLLSPATTGGVREEVRPGMLSQEVDQLLGSGGVAARCPPRALPNVELMMSTLPPCLFLFCPGNR